MRRIPGLLAVCLAGLGLTGPARGGDAPSAADPEKAKKVDAILAEWECKSATITQVDATFTRADRKTVFKSRTDYEGRALLKGPNLTCLEFKKVDPEDKARKTFHERIICTGAEIVQYDGEVKLVNVYPLPDEEQLRKLAVTKLGGLAGLVRGLSFAAEGGPMTFLRPQKAEALKDRYRVEWVGESGRVHRLRLVPRGEGDRELLSAILIDLNKATLLPDALQIQSPNGKETQTYTFATIKPNAPIAPGNFQLREVKGYKIIRMPAAKPGPVDPKEPGAEPKGPESPGADDGSR